jgi:hypothetical protein
MFRYLHEYAEFVVLIVIQRERHDALLLIVPNKDDNLVFSQSLPILLDQRFLGFGSHLALEGPLGIHINPLFLEVEQDDGLLLSK